MTLLGKLKQVVEESDGVGLWFDVAIQILIVISLISFAIETLPDVGERTRRGLDLLEVTIVLLFTAEYVLRVLVADRRVRFILSFYGLVDIVAILPFYFATGLDLRSVRALRLLRLFRIFKLTRYSAAIHRCSRAFRMVREDLVLFMCLSGIVLYLASVGIYYFERDAQPESFASVFHSLWWAVATLTTVGYGDVYPVTAGGKIFTGVVLLIGLGIVAVPTGMVAAAFAEVREVDREGRASLERP